MNEVPYVALPECKRSLKIGRSRRTRDEYNNERVVLSVSLPLCIKGATPPRPDPGHPLSLVCGIVKRFGFQPPKVDPQKARSFRRFVQLFLKHNFVPLLDSDVPSVEDWLGDCDYEAHRKQELLDLWNTRSGIVPTQKELQRVKSFVKDETYETPKYPRLINSRVDIAKCLYGPLVAAVSERVFATHWFIKKVPVVDRPEVIFRKLFVELAEVNFTDYTSFEAHFTAEIMNLCQYEMFDFFTKFLSDRKMHMWFQKFVLQNVNNIEFKDVKVWLEATRMSGEMDTSLSNGFFNLMMYLYLVWTNHKDNTGVEVPVTKLESLTLGFVEGDDGLFRNVFPEDTPTTEQFAELGMTIKVGQTRHLNEASFCGQVYDMDEKIVVTDVREALARFGWTNKRYVLASDRVLMQLLRAKGYSFVYQYNGCPILGLLGRKILELTEGVVISDKILYGMDQWERSKLREALNSTLPEYKHPGISTRHLVEKLYGVTILEQEQCEQIISEASLYEPLELPIRFPDEWVSYYDTYHHSFYDRCPLWLNRPEDELEQRLLKACPQANEFIASLRGKREDHL